MRRAAAKINLALHVVGRRADGYHLLDSLAVFADVGDRVTLAPAEGLDLAVSGRFAAHAPADPTDLSWRAAEAFFAHVGRPLSAAIRVEKELPAGAGLGGGSADAAAVLAGLNELCDTGVAPETLRAIGLRLGADVPMCLAGRALRAGGVGEEIDFVGGWPPLPMVLVWPARGVSTAAVFKALERRDNPPLTKPPAGGTPADIALWLAGCRNDLEAPARAVAPEIDAVLKALRATPACLLARMSGSGSACFGLYSDLAAAEAAAATIAAAEPAWWVRAATAT